MKEQTNRIKTQESQYKVERRFRGTRTAEDVIAALIRAHH